MLERIAEWAAPARVRVAYPGLWVRPDVYATHGHYLDCHLTVPTIERLSVGVMSRLLGRPASAFDERRRLRGGDGARCIAWRDAVARDARTGDALNGIATVHAWRALRRARRRTSGARRRRARSAHAARVAAAQLRRARSCAASRSRSPRSTAPGSARCAPTISSGELRGAGLARDGRGRRAARARRRLRRLRPHPPRRARCPAIDEREWSRGPRRRGPGRAADQHRQLDLRLDLPHRARPARAPTGRGLRARRGLRAAACCSACCSTARTPSSRDAQRRPARREARRQAASRRASELEREHARGVALVLDQRVGARVRDRELALAAPPGRRSTRTVPAPSSTAHTPPAS